MEAKVNMIAPSAKPVQLRICLVLMVVSLVYNVAAVVGQTSYYADFLDGSYVFALIIRMPQYVAMGVLIYLIYRGYSWARSAWTVMYFVLLVLFVCFFAFNVEKTPLIILLVVYVLAIAQIIALVLLWNPKTTRWFRAAKEARKKSPGVTVDDVHEACEDSTGQDLNGVVGVLAEPVDVSRKGMAHDSLLKIIRAIRVLYVLLAVKLFVGGLSTYGAVLDILSAQGMDVDALGFAMLSRTIIPFLLAILLLSAAYSIAENIIEGKLQSYPTALRDRSFSSFGTLTAAFVYVYSLSYLSLAIVKNVLFVDQSIHLPVIVYDAFLLLLYLLTVYGTYRYLIKNIDRQTWKYYWIAALCCFPVMMMAVRAVSDLMFQVERRFVELWDISGGVF